MSASVFAIDGNTVDATGEITPFDTITLAVSAGGDELIVNSKPTLTLNNGATAAYAGGSGTDELLFVYTPNSGDDIATLGVTQLSGTVIDENSFLPSQISVPATSFIGVNVDTTPPSLTLTGTSADALQGGNPANAASASIADPNGDGTLTGASIAIANLQPGDALGIAGATTGTQMGVSWSYAANTGILVLTGCATLTTYETLLGDLTYQDGGTDDSAAGHPIRTLDWSISEGPLTGSAQTSITIDRPPVLLGTYDLDTVPDGYPTGGSGAALTGDSDPDGDALTITSVSDFRGTMAAGTGIAGAYGELTLDGDGSYSYYAYNTLALDAAPDGAPPVDQFTFTVSDGYGGTAAEDFYVTIDRTPVIASFGINATVTVGGQVTGGAGALLAGDSDPDR